MTFGHIDMVRGTLSSPACGRGRAKGASEGSLPTGGLSSGGTLTPILSRKRERVRTSFVASNQT